ncbi:FecR family protein [Chryseobacterium profundimaris]|uniref:FecR family protein n=1 Tax=Chryseobacterium profundimaris TaxID=1387275 RepID=A0ABY1NWK6_9FLAO|nr:FecR family protein [Chryseobacterium profundimaris]SMP20249.1 FecR family protein [Chryseobacterium profundimaris]
MENDQNIQSLFAKYLDNTISADEYEALLHYFGKQEDNGELYELVLKEVSGGLPVRNQVRLEKAVDAVSHRLRDQLQPKKIVGLGKYIPYAAAVFLFITIGISFYIISTRTSENNDPQIAVADVNPGHSAATLTLADGKRIFLNDASIGAIANDQGISVSKTKNGELVYTIKEANGIPENTINTLSTANGETYQIVLSDGTRVWLNAATTLQYAANLGAGKSRNVKLLTGEAYFEVQKDKKHPFIVETPAQKVEVLGTHFNINSYADEGKTVTTLAEGSVKVSTSGDRERHIILKPGEQSLAVNNNIKVREADLQAALAWKDGKIYFKDAPIQEVLRQVSRWYNIQIEYRGTPTEEVFNGGIKRNENLSSVLRILELSNVNFKLIKRNNIHVLIVSKTY